MMTSLLGNDLPAFDDPLEILLACHDQICTQCDTLDRLVAHLMVQGNTDKAAQAARTIMRYFDIAGHNHHLDEENDLFPALIASGNQEIVAHIARLTEEHKALDAAWLALRKQLDEVARGVSDIVDADIAADFINKHTQHLAFENRTVLPLAEKLLSAEQLHLLGQHMAKRRGVAS